MGFRKRKTQLGRIKPEPLKVVSSDEVINLKSSPSVKAALHKRGIEPAHGSGSLAKNIEKLRELGAL